MGLTVREQVAVIAGQGLGALRQVRVGDVAGFDIEGEAASMAGQ
jgi:hypothetical protein